MTVAELLEIATLNDVRNAVGSGRVNTDALIPQLEWTDRDGTVVLTASVLGAGRLSVGEAAYWLGAGRWHHTTIAADGGRGEVAETARYVHARMPLQGVRRLAAVAAVTADPWA